MSKSRWAGLRRADPALAAVQRRLATPPAKLAVLDGPPLARAASCPTTAE